MKVKEGKSFTLTPALEVLNYLSGLDRKKLSISPNKLKISNKESNNSEELFLMVSNGSTRRYEIRKTFVMKLLRWYHFPTSIISKLKTDTLVLVCNDFLGSINSSSVNVKMENDEALTITSSKYSDFSDKEILEICLDKLSIGKISRNDFAMRIYSKEKINLEPIPGDECGFGFNIFNSETGFLALQVSHFMLRYSCANGAVIPVNSESSRLYHVNQSKEKIIEYLISNVEEINKNRDHVVQKILLMQEHPVLKKLNSYKFSLGYIIGLSDATKIINEFTQYAEGKLQGEYHDDKYSLFNFITNKAKNYGLIERMQMEEMAGKLVLN